MAKYFTTCRIDHILGFFRIWELPDHAVTGLRGKFRPSIPLSQVVRVVVLTIRNLFQKGTFGALMIDLGLPQLVQSLKAQAWSDDAMIGDYLGQHKEFSLSVMHAYVDSMKFSGMKFDVAIHKFLKGFRLPEEAQKIDPEGNQQCDLPLFLCNL